MAIPLRCVECSADLSCPIWPETALRCEVCGAHYPVVSGVLVALPSQEERLQCVEGKRPDPAGEFYNGAFWPIRCGGHAESERLRAYRRSAERWEHETRGLEGAALEIGSGRGTCSGVGGPDYLGLDYSLSALLGSGTAPGIVGDAQELPLSDASCRFVYSFTTLEHVLRPEAAFGEIDRVLAPGGVALLRPAWHCLPWQDRALETAGPGELSPWRRARRLALQVRALLPVKAALAMGPRLVRRVGHSFRRRPTSLHYHRLQPRYDLPEQEDADATCSLDSHEGILYFESRGYEVLSHPSLTRRMLARHDDVVVRKPRG